MESQPSIREVKINIDNELVLNLVNYLIRVEKYVFVGNETEIWLENLAHPRIQLIYLNDQQLYTAERAFYISQKADIITSQIKRKFLMPKVNFLVLNTYEGIGDQINQNLQHGLIINLPDAEAIKTNKTLQGLFPQIISAEMTTSAALIIANLQRETRERATQELAFASLRTKPIVTYVFLAIITLFFGFLWWQSREIPSWFVAIYYGSVFNPLVMAGDYWRIITANLMHVELLHFLFNAVIIYRFGTLVETVVGRWRMTVIVIISMITTSLFHLAFSPASGIGASGVTFGLMGVLVFLGFEMRKAFMPFLRESLLPMLIINIVASVMLPNVGFWGHVGGFVGGFIAVAIVGIKGVKPFFARTALTIVTLLVLICGLWIGALRMNENHNFSDLNRAIIHNYRVMGNHNRANRLQSIIFPERGR